MKKISSAFIFVSILFYYSIVVQLGYCQEIQAIDIGTLGGNYSLAIAINNFGQIIGTSKTDSGERHGFFWEPTNGMVDLGNNIWVNGINDLSQVTGYRQLPVGKSAIKWTQEFGIMELGSLEGSEYCEPGERGPINNLGQVVGYCVTQEGYRAFLWSSQTGMVNLGTTGGNYSEALAINDLGQIMGWVTSSSGRGLTFFWSAETGMIEIGTLGGEGTDPWDINNLGQIVGSSETESGDMHAFVWSTEDGMLDLGTLGGDFSEALGVNDAGQIVGNSTTSSGKMSAFLWAADTGMIGLGSLDPVADDSGAFDINNYAQIVGESGHQSFVWTIENGMVALGTLGGDFSNNSDQSNRVINDQGQIVGHASIANNIESHATLWEVPIPPQTPQEEVERIMILIRNLISSGAMDERSSKSILVKLEAFIRFANVGHTIPACKVLNAFINQINAEISTGQLLPESGQKLIKLGESISICN
ncbi:hypothetical protein [Desulforhopalus singaporensis]|uniref:Probable extracellular repeat, HAF family n=1 Tax=Desulforhopalus singaporensis TaxID=91360 RepID=A0A1H0UW39_9BACT|nr:hypothetical protein [Desulforhopalus singaporensis]SDP70128.1 probable extracellular repeat, HAF family [Desulforhopalus singaporensis]